MKLPNECSKKAMITVQRRKRGKSMKGMEAYSSDRLSAGMLVYANNSGSLSFSYKTTLYTNYFSDVVSLYFLTVHNMTEW